MSKYLLIFLLLLFFWQVNGRKHSKSFSSSRNGSRNKMKKNKSAWKRALKKIERGELTSFTAETVITDKNNQQNIECKLLSGAQKTKNGLSVQNIVLCKQQSSSKNEQHVKIFEFKEEHIIYNKGKHKVEEDFRAFEVFQYLTITNDSYQSQELFEQKQEQAN